MLFKQKPINGIIFIVCLLNIPCLVFSICAFIFDFLFGLVLILLSIILLLITLPLVQWFYVYDDRIEVHSVFGKVNEVYFENVIDVIEKELPVMSRAFAPHYIFDDGRKEKWCFESTFQNHRNRMVRIYITEELKELIEDKKFNTIQYQRY